MTKEDLMHGTNGGPLNFKDAAYIILKYSLHPLSAQDITTVALKTGIIQTVWLWNNTFFISFYNVILMVWYYNIYSLFVYIDTIAREDSPKLHISANECRYLKEWTQIPFYQSWGRNLFHQVSVVFNYDHHILYLLFLFPHYLDLS